MRKFRRPRYVRYHSIYPKEMIARAIELYREVEKGNLLPEFIQKRLAEEFPELPENLKKHLKNGNPSLKIIRNWVEQLPNLPEILKGQITYDSYVRELFKARTFLMMSSIVASIFQVKDDNVLLSDNALI